jgi:predicted metal-binding membrane protein
VDWFSINIWSQSLLDWLLMVAAMMVPLIIIPMRIAALRSLWCRRHRAIGGFLVGYFGAWMLAGLVCVPILISLRTSRFEGTYLWAFGFLIAALWQITSWKRLAKLGCHRTIPLAPNTWKADFDCFRFGLIHGRSCVTSCWALMLSPMLISHSLAAMMSTCLVCGYERYRARLEDRKIAKGLAFAAAGLLAVGLFVLRTK